MTIGSLCVSFCFLNLLLRGSLIVWALCNVWITERKIFLLGKTTVFIGEGNDYSEWYLKKYSLFDIGFLWVVNTIFSTNNIKPGSFDAKSINETIVESLITT